MLVNLVQLDADGDPVPETIIPLIDGGTEGLKGQGRVIIPKVTSCFECTIGLFPPQKNFPMCTIAETPRIAEHCITYVYVLEWGRHFPDKKLDKDSPADMQWVYERALERAERYGIAGVTYFKTLGVVKNIIPAVASTNAVIAAVCVNEALKLVTYSSQTLNTYFMYVGNEGVNTPVFDNARLDTCIVCSRAAEARKMCVSSSMTLADFLQELCMDPVLQLKKPSVMGESINLYMQRPPSLEACLRPNLAKTMGELVASGETLTVTDPTLHDVSVTLELQLL
jgi:ubiquitin-activating enzyme E1 C